MLISTKVLSNVITREKNNNGAIFTIKSISTGKDYTYRISRKNFGEKWFTFVRVEKGYLNFTYLGSYFKGNLWNKRNKVETPSAKAIGFVLDFVEKGKFDFLDEKMEMTHEGSCIICGKTLTDAVSIKRGIGPVCAGTH